MLENYFNSFAFPLFFPDHSYFSKWAVLLGPEPTEIKVSVFESMMLMITLIALIAENTEDGGEDFLPRCVAFVLGIVNESIGIRL